MPTHILPTATVPTPAIPQASPVEAFFLPKESPEAQWVNK